MKGEINSNTITVGEFNTAFTTMNRSSKQNIISKHLKWYIRPDGSHWYLQDFPSKCRIHLLLRCTWSILQDRPHLGSQISKFKKIEIVIKHLFWPQCYETRYQLQEGKKKKPIKNTNTYRLNNMFLNNEQLLRKSKGKSKKF